MISLRKRADELDQIALDTEAQAQAENEDTLKLKQLKTLLSSI